MKTKSEMSKLLWSFTIPVFILIAAILALFLVDSIMSTNNNAELTKKLLINQIVDSYRRLGENFQSMNFNPEVLKLLSPDMLQAFARGDVDPVFALIMNVSVMASPAEYVALVKDGSIYKYSAKSGVTVKPEQLLTSPPPNDYKIIKEFGGKEGTLLYAFYPIDLSIVGLDSKIYISSVFDITEQVKEIDSYFNEQKRDNIIKLVVAAIIALVVFGLLLLFWLRYLIKRFIAGPINQLNTTAEEIVAGTFEGEVEVDQSSDFSALQGLLRSGQLILRKHDEDLSGSGGES
jgi:hypothetical protein